MSRVEHLGEGVTLYLGDCREIAPTLPRPAAVISDPPYGQSLDTVVVKSGKARGLGGKSNIYPKMQGDDAPFDPAALCSMADNVLLWGAHKFHARLPDGGRWLFWDKRVGVLPEWDQGCGEMAWHNMDGAVRVCRLMWGGLIMAAGSKGEEPKERCHPSQKPIGLMRWCIEQAKVDPGALIFDPYMGGGSTGVAAVQLGHAFTGIEIEPRYFDTACRRIAAELARPRLPLPEPVAKAVQGDMLDYSAAQHQPLFEVGS